MKPDRIVPFKDVIIASVGIGLAVLLRLILRSCVNDDIFYLNVSQSGVSGQTGTWYAIIHERGFSAFRDVFSDYTPPYLYCLYLISLVDAGLSPIFAVKIPSMLADFAAAFYVYRIVRLKHGEGAIPLFAFLATLFWPTVVVNSAVWGQTDILFTAPLVASLYYFLRGRHHAAWIAFAIAFVVKLQTVFFLPFLLTLLVRKETGWRYILYVPLVYVAAAVPMWLAGRPFLDLMTIYVMQAKEYSQLTMDAPSLYAWLPVPENQVAAFGDAGVIFAAAIAFLMVAFVFKSRVRLTSPGIILMAFASVLIVPFVLPRMHQRYFFTADVLSLVYAFTARENIYVAVAVTSASLLSYTRFLFGTQLFPTPALSFVMLGAILIVSRQLTDMFYPREQHP